MMPIRGGFKAESLLGHITRKASPPSLLLPPLFPPFSLPSLSSPPLIPPVPSLRSRPLKSSYGVWGSAVSSPVGSGAEPEPKSYLAFRGPPRPGGLQGPASQGPRRPLHEWPPVKSAPWCWWLFAANEVQNCPQSQSSVLNTRLYEQSEM